jgi:putative ABC transport system ATP-binding protein
VNAPVQLTEVRKVYGAGPGSVTALDGVTYGFAEGTFTAVMGPSGSGKSTLLHCAFGLDSPTSGDVQPSARRLGELSGT